MLSKICEKKGKHMFRATGKEMWEEEEPSPGWDTAYRESGRAQPRLLGIFETYT